MDKTITTRRYQKLISYLTEKRLEQGLSLRELAAKLGVTHSWVQRIETLERRLDVFEYMVYCEALEINAQETLRYLE